MRQFYFQAHMLLAGILKHKGKLENSMGAFAAAFLCVSSERNDEKLWILSQIFQLGLISEGNVNVLGDKVNFLKYTK